MCSKACPSTGSCTRPSRRRLDQQTELTKSGAGRDGKIYPFRAARLSLDEKSRRTKGSSTRPSSARPSSRRVAAVSRRLSPHVRSTQLIERRSEIGILIAMNRTHTVVRRMSDTRRDDAVPGTPAQRIGLVWPLTREVASLSKHHDVERRLQRHVTSLGRREG